MYYPRLIDKYLLEWRERKTRKPLLLRAARNSKAEIDYLIPRNNEVCPVEIKAGKRGGMKSLWIFMREKSLTDGVRSSLENFGRLDYTDPETGVVRHIILCPLYALSRLAHLG